MPPPGPVGCTRPKFLARPAHVNNNVARMALRRHLYERLHYGSLPHYSESAMSAVSNPLLSPPASNCCQLAICPSLSSLSLNFDVHFRFEQIMPFVCFRAFRMEIQRSAQVRVLYVFQRANIFSQHNRSYYVPRWPKCLVPTLAPISGAFSPLMPYTMVNILMMCAASSCSFVSLFYASLKSHGLHAVIAFAARHLSHS
jgi:hypothetical protein